jgi:hypothetical protein
MRPNAVAEPEYQLAAPALPCFLTDHMQGWQEVPALLMVRPAELRVSRAADGHQRQGRGSPRARLYP